jgi:serine O-acetyltransferase
MKSKSAFKSDIERFYRIEFGSVKVSAIRRFRFWLRNFGLHCVAVYRFGKLAERISRRNRLLGLPFSLVHAIFNYSMQLIHHVNIDDASIGPGFYIGHVGTIYIGPVVIGMNFSVTHNVTIGVGHSEGKSGVPTIGDNVWIGTGSVVSGAITVGNGVTIANGTMLAKSVADACLVAGNPGRVVMNNYDNRELLALEP